MDTNKLKDAIRELSHRHSHLSQDDALEDYRDTLKTVLLAGESISYTDATTIIDNYPKKNNWKVFVLLVDELNCIHDKKTFNQCLRKSFQHSSFDRDYAIRYFSHELFEPCLMMDNKEYDSFLALPPELLLYRGAPISEYLSKKYELSWTTNIYTALGFAFFEYTNKNPNERTVLFSTIKKSSIKAKYDSYRDGSEFELVAILEDNHPSEMIITWKEFLLSDEYEQIRVLCQKKYGSKYTFMLNHYPPAE